MAIREATVVFMPGNAAAMGAEEGMIVRLVTRPESLVEHEIVEPRHLQAQGKIERGHQTMKNRVLLENHLQRG